MLGDARCRSQCWLHWQDIGWRPAPPTASLDVGWRPMRVVIAEDLALLRDGMIRLLRDHGHEVVAAVEDGEALVRAASGHKPDICVVDVRMPPTFTDEGVKAALQVRERVPGTAVLIVSQYIEETYAAELLADGRGG